jgi:hypothetical protein
VKNTEAISGANRFRISVHTQEGSEAARSRHGAEALIRASRLGPLLV